LQEKITRYFIELAPSGRQVAEATLTHVPPFVVCGAEAVAPTLKKSNFAYRSLGKLRIQRRIEFEGEQ
jgi:hypothetical protein